MTFVLVHSPLLGPGSWAPVAEELRSRRQAVTVPDLRSALDQPVIWEAQVKAVVDALPSGSDRTLWFVAHSGAGPLLPAIQARLEGPPAGYLFVDAAMPHPGRSRLETLPQELRIRFRMLEEEGVLRPWHRWFGSDTIERLLPDPAMRERFVAELPQVPMRMFEEKLPDNRGWPNAPCCYLRLSEAYLQESVAAVGLGCRAAVLEGDHLSIVTRPRQVVDAMLRLMGPT